MICILNKRRSITSINKRNQVDFKGAVKRMVYRLNVNNLKEYVKHISINLEQLLLSVIFVKG